MANQLENRDERILEAALACALAEGWQWITAAGVAAAAGVAKGSIYNAYGDMRGLKRAVLQEAVTRRIVSLVAQGLAEKHPIAVDGADDELKKAAADYVAG